MFLGGFGIDNFNVNSKWTIGGDGKNMIESDNFYFNSEFNAGIGTFSGGCYGGGKFNWGALIGNVVGGASMIAMALLARGRGGAGAAGLGGILSAGRCYYGAGGGSYGIGGGSSIFGNGFGGDLYSPTGYTGTINPLNNPNPIHLPGLRFGEAGDGVDGTKKTATDEAGKKDGADADKKTTPGADKKEGLDADKKTTPGADKKTTPGADKKTTPGSTTGTTTGTTGGNGNIVIDLSKLSDDQKAKAKAQGSALLNAVNDKASDGSTDKLFAGEFTNKSNANVENGATLKQDDSVRKNWHKGQASTPTNQDYKDAVKVGDAKGNNTETDPTTGAPKYFTMTDYRSGNQYSFKLYGYNTQTGKLQYKVDTQNSNLSSDNNGINGKNWEFAGGAENLVFEVDINEASGEIELSYDGNKVSTNKLVRQG